MIMSRRKQSNPKPLLQKRDDEDAGDEQQQQQQPPGTTEENGAPASQDATVGHSDSSTTTSSSNSSTLMNNNSRSSSRSSASGCLGMNGTDAAAAEEGPVRPTATPSPMAADASEDGAAQRSPSLREIKLEPNVPSDTEPPPSEAPVDPVVRCDSKLSHSGGGSPATTSPIPMLRLNVALASDPAANPDAKDLKNIGEADAVAAEFAQQQLAALNMAIGGPPPPPPPMRKPPLKGPEGLVGPLALPAVVELPPRLPMFVCGPCGIRFSSASTLEAHQTYYCSHRKETEDGGGAGGGTGSTAGTGGSASGGSIGGGGTKNAHPGGDGSGEPPAKAAKTGKQYACSQCSYSADKKVSLNRHMRMHQSSPTPSSVNGDDTGRQQQQHHHQQQQQQLQLIQAQAVAAAAAVLHQQQQQQQLQPQPVGQAQGPPPQVDRYCSDCDIRFSSTKTYRAHKQHYCSSRHREGQQSNNSTPKPGSAQKSGSQSPPEVPKTPPVAAAQQPFLALPTNPIIVIPYSLIRGASVIPGLLPSLAPGVANPESACFIFQNGTLQPIAMSLASQVAHQAATSAGAHAEVGPGPQRPPSQQHPSRGTTPSVSNENSSHSTQGAVPTPGAPSSTGEVLKALNKRENSANKESTLTSTTTPLDLSVRRFSPSAIGALRERSLSLSSAVSGDQRMDYDSLMEGKENLSVSGDSLTPEQIVCAPSLPGSPPLTPSPKRRSNSPRATGPGPMASNTALAAAAAAVAGHHAGHLGAAATLSLSPMTLQQQLMRPLLPADIALRLSADPSVCSLNLSILAAPGATPHPLLTPKQSVELALRLSTPAGDGKHQPQQISPLLNSISPTAAASGGASVLPSGAAPQIFVKQGDSKCKECNIVFCKYENYLAHKKHYCSARNQDDGGGGGEGAKVSPPISPQTGTSPSAGAPLSTAGGGPRPPVGTGVAYQQLICAACGIKFTSLDNLTAHQMYYCPKRIDVGGPVSVTPTSQLVAVSQPQPHKERCSKCKSIHEPGQPCTVAGHGAYKCPICEVISPNSTEARRHMDTHGGVKAFRCTICRYKGNTLRGMRTHIRMHFDKKTSEFNEENYITCILEEDGIEIPPAGAQNAAAVAAAAAALASATHKFLAQDGSGPPDVTGSPSVRHHCELCPFTTSDRVNMIKHIKQVHGGGRSVPFGLDTAELYNGIAAGAVVELAVRPPIASTPGPGSSSTSSSLIKTEPIDDRSPSPSGGDQDTTADINVDVCLEETAPVATTVKTEAIDPHMPSLNSPLAGSPSPPSSLNLKPKSQTPTTAGDAISSSLVRRSDTPTRAKTPSPPVPPTPLTLEHLPPGPKYCDTCDITFNYAKTYIAHKNFYCKAIPLAGGSATAATGQPAAGTGRRSASVSPNGGATSPAVTVAVNRATETSV